MQSEQIETETVQQNIPELPQQQNGTVEAPNEDGFTIPNFSGELINTFLSIYCKFRPELDKDLFLLTDEEKAIISQLLDKVLLKTLQKIGIRAKDFEIVISLIVIAFPRVYSVYIVESQRAKLRKQNKEGDKNGQADKIENKQ